MASVWSISFPLPNDQQRAISIPAFDAVWTVNVGSRSVTERTPFDRILMFPVETEYDYGPDYWGAPYWYDPYYPNVTFVGGAPLGPLFGPGVVIHVHGGYHRGWRR